MKSAKNYNFETEYENTQLRRKVMNSTKMLFVIFSAAAVLIGGCSGDHRVTGPVADVSLDIEGTNDVLTKLSGDAGNLTGLTEESQEQTTDRISFEATMKKSEVEGGCWYLETDKGARYTPYFEMGSHKLNVGDRILVFGYIDENMSSYCMIGPVFCVEKFTLISRGDDTASEGVVEEIAGHVASGSARAAADEYQAGSNDAASQEEFEILKGQLGVTEEGCYYLYAGKGIIAELYFVQRICPMIKVGTPIVVEGSYSLLTWSPCQMAELFNVERFWVPEDKELVVVDSKAGK